MRLPELRSTQSPDYSDQGGRRVSITKQTNPYDLTPAEIEFLRSAKIPDEVKGYLARQHENVGLKITSFRKVAAAANAETDAIRAVLDLAAAHGELVRLDQLKARLHATEQRASSLEATVAQRDAKIMQITAGPALATHAAGTSR